MVKHTHDAHFGSCGVQQLSALVTLEPIPEDQCIKKQELKIYSVLQTLYDGLIYIPRKCICDITKVQESNGRLNDGHKSLLPEEDQFRWTEWG